MVILLTIRDIITKFVNKYPIKMKHNCFSIRLRAARLMSGLSMAQLADRCRIRLTRQSISRYEQGAMTPKPPLLHALAEALAISTDYLMGHGVEIDRPMLRTGIGSGMGDEAAEMISAQVAYWAEQYLAEEQRTGIAHMFVNEIAPVVVGTQDEALKAAQLLRKSWRCGEGPLPHLLRLMERKGIKILDTPLPKDVYGLSTWADAIHPLIIIDSRPEKTTVERLRFTACHELGHLMLTIADGTEAAMTEKLCSKFASYFLFPPDTYIEEVGERRDSITLAELADLRSVYGTSIAAMVHQAYDLGVIGREHYDWWYDEMIKENPREEGWGQYDIAETIGREKRIKSIAEKGIPRTQ